MAFTTLPTFPDPPPLRSQDPAVFDANMALWVSAFEEFTSTYLPAFETTASGLEAALLAANLPSLAGKAHKLPYVNHTGTGVELDNPVKIASAVAFPSAKVGDHATLTYADAAATTIDLDAGLAVTKVHKILMLGIARLRLTADSAERSYGIQMTINGSIQSLSQNSGSIIQGVNNIEQLSTFAVLSTATSGSAVPIALRTACDDDVVVDRAHVMAIAIRGN